MLHSFLRKYLSIIFILTTLVGISHHHDDLKSHSDCQICTIQSNITNIDTPTEVLYLSKLDIFSQIIDEKTQTSYTLKPQLNISARAPPKLS